MARASNLGRTLSAMAAAMEPARSTATPKPNLPGNSQSLLRALAGRSLALRALVPCALRCP